MPWGEMMRAATRMGVGPDGFWRLSLKEWRMLTEVGWQGAPMGRVEMETLEAAWPDAEVSLPAGEGERKEKG